MSSVGLALIRTASVGQEFAQKPASNPTPAPPYGDALAGGSTRNPVASAAPEDTVTISKALSPFKPLQNQSTSDILGSANSNAPAVFRPAAGQYDLLNAKPNSNPSAVNSAQVNANGNAQNLKPTAAQPTSVSAQEQLQELDRTLQQLGINPESVSLIRRVELLRLANNPAALEQYFQTSPPTAASSTSTLGSQTSSNTPNPSTPSEGATPTSTNSQNTPPATPSVPSTGSGNRLNVSA